jgi:hypothetical protein
MSKLERLAGFVGLLMLVLFLAPYIIKLSQLDITLILAGGVALAAYDFFGPRKR